MASENNANRIIKKIMDDYFAEKANRDYKQVCFEGKQAKAFEELKRKCEMQSVGSA